MNRDNKSAFPSPTGNIDSAGGISIRDYFAAHALAGGLNPALGNYPTQSEAYARLAYSIADAMMHVRDL